jgi:hypothetical protein
LRSNRIVYVALVLMVLILLCGCQDKLGDADVTTIDTSEPMITVFESGVTRYNIIWPTRPADEEFSAAVKLQGAFGACGITITHGRDNVDDIPETEYEILIGKTNREESASICSDLRNNDWVIAVSGIKIVLCGGTPALTLKAVERFISDYLPAGTESLLLVDGLYIKEGGSYPVVELLINNKNISAFRLVRPAAATKLETYAAQLLSDAIRERTGVSLESVNDRAPASEYEIRIGATARSGAALGDYEYVIYADGASIIINGGKHAIVRAVLDFIAEHLPAESEVAVNAEIKSIRTIVKNEKKTLPHEPSLDGKNLVALCDQKNASVVVIDIDAPDPTSEPAIVWTWKPTSELGFSSTSGYGNYVDEAILRYSEVLGSYVLCVTSSSGFMGVAKYPSGEAVWSGVASGFGPHSIEYLPNGNVAVACSGNSNIDNGCIRIYTASQGRFSGKYISIPLTSAHGVVWDDINELLWVLGATELRAYRIGGTDADPTLTQVAGMGGAIPTSGGHNLSVSGTDPDCLWISGSRAACQYRKSTGTFIEDYPGAPAINGVGIKSMDSFPDGRVVRALATNVYKAHNTDRMVIFKFGADGTPTRREYVFPDRAFYKARKFSAHYSN